MRRAAGVVGHRVVDVAEFGGLTTARESTCQVAAADEVRQCRRRTVTRFRLTLTGVNDGTQFGKTAANQIGQHAGRHGGSADDLAGCRRTGRRRAGPGLGEDLDEALTAGDLLAVAVFRSLTVHIAGFGGVHHRRLRDDVDDHRRCRSAVGRRAIPGAAGACQGLVTGGQCSECVRPALLDGSRIVVADGVGQCSQAAIQQSGVRLMQLTGEVGRSAPVVDLDVPPARLRLRASARIGVMALDDLIDGHLHGVHRQRPPTADGRGEIGVDRRQDIGVEGEQGAGDDQPDGPVVDGPGREDRRDRGQSFMQADRVVQ